MHVEELLFLRKHIATLTKEIRLLGTTESYSESLKLLRSLPGIDLITGMILLTEIGDIRRFRNENALASFVGLVPGEHSSGEQQTRGSMTRRRNSALRHILIEAAWQASAKDEALLLRYTKDKSRMGANRAIVRVARTLLRRIRYVLINRTECKPVQS